MKAECIKDGHGVQKDVTYDLVDHDTFYEVKKTGLFGKGIIGKDDFNEYFKKVGEKMEQFKVGDKRKSKWNNLTYEVTDCYNESYRIESDSDVKGIYISEKDLSDNFEPLADDIIRIKEWVDLDGRKNEDYEIYSRPDGKQWNIEIDHRKSSEYSESVFENGIEPETILAWLKLFGFSVEFEPEHKLTSREYGCCLMYEEGRIVRHIDGQLWKYNGSSGFHIPSDLFPWITHDTGSIEVKELMKLERESGNNA